MILNTALKVIFASALVLGPGGAAATGANGGTRKDVRGGKQDDEADVHSMIQKLQEEVSQLKARLLNTATELTTVGEDATGVNDRYGSLDLCETADLLHGINARTGKADLSDHTHDINVQHNHSTNQTDHDHPIDVDHSHNLTLPKIKCTCTYKYDEKETTAIETETWAGPTSTGGGQANITIEDALATETTQPANEDLTHDHDLTDLLLGLDAAGKELSYAADSYGTSECPEPTLAIPRSVDFAPYPTCDNPGTCGSYTPCNVGSCGGFLRACATTVFGDGLCAVNFSCDDVTACPGGQSDCGPDEVCIVGTCCSIAPVGPDVCLPSSYFCDEFGVSEVTDVGGAVDADGEQLTAFGNYNSQGEN